MKRWISAVAILVLAMIGGGAGVVFAQAAANPSSDVMYEPFVYHVGGPGGSPGFFAEGVTISEFNGLYMGGECGTGSVYGLVTTTRLGSRVIQELVRNDGESCSRVGTVGDFEWDPWQFNGVAPE